MKRILVTGSRDWTTPATIYDALLLHSGGKETILVHGACETGADAIADMIASNWPWAIERHPADWHGPCTPDCTPGHRRRGHGGTYCPTAGYRRNQEMVDLGADAVLAFQRNNSRGTADCIRRAKKAGLIIWRYTA